MTRRALSRSLALWCTRPALEAAGLEPASEPQLTHCTIPRRGFLASVAGLLAAGLNRGIQAQEVSGEDLKPRQEVLTTKDFPAMAVAITYWPSKLKQDGGVVVLVHGEKKNQLEWGKAFPEMLQREGFAVIAVDLRGHGQTKLAGGSDETVETGSKKKPKTTKLGPKEIDPNHLKAIDYENMVVYDMEAVKSFIYSENQEKKLNMNKMAIVGAGMGAAIAMSFAKRDWEKPPHEDGPEGNQTPRGQDVRALVLLTPDSAVPKLQLPLAIDTLRAPLRQVAMLFAIGKNDKRDKGSTKALFEQAAKPESENNNSESKNIYKKRMYYVEYNSPAVGAALLGKNLPVEGQILGFLKSYVLEAKSDWRDRQSRVGRKKA